MDARQRAALVIKESRGEEGLGSAGQPGQHGESAMLGKRRPCVLGKGEPWR